VREGSVRHSARIAERTNEAPAGALDRVRGSHHIYLHPQIAEADYHINVFWSDEDGCYVADIPDLAFCSAFGDTPEEALRQVLQAKAA
jgi:hypothetical protein